MSRGGGHRGKVHPLDGQKAISPGALTRRWNCRSGLSRSWLLDDWPSPMKSTS